MPIVMASRQHTATNVGVRCSPRNTGSKVVEADLQTAFSCHRERLLTLLFRRRGSIALSLALSLGIENPVCKSLDFHLFIAEVEYISFDL